MLGDTLPCTRIIEREGLIASQQGGEGAQAGAAVVGGGKRHAQLGGDVIGIDSGLPRQIDIQRKLPRTPECGRRQNAGQQDEPCGSRCQRRE